MSHGCGRALAGIEWTGANRAEVDAFCDEPREQERGPAWESWPDRIPSTSIFVRYEDGCVGLFTPRDGAWASQYAVYRRTEEGKGTA